MAKGTKGSMRVIRHRRLRKSVLGTSERPRLAVFRSLRHVSAQVIDDTKGQTICSASSEEKALEAQGNIEGAKLVGKVLAKRALDKGLAKVVFDRGGFRYHGVVKALAESAREGGLEF